MLHQIMDVLNRIDQALGGASSGSLLVVLAFVTEAIQKLWPTANPQGWLLLADSALKRVGEAIQHIGEAVGKCGDVCAHLDGLVTKIIPQNIK